PRVGSETTAGPLDSSPGLGQSRFLRPSAPMIDRVKRIVLGVAGGIAAYKAVELLRLLTEAGHEVTVVPTASALKFVGEPTWAALSHRPVASDVWTDADQVPHVLLGRQADLVIVA